MSHLPRLNLTHMSGHSEGLTHSRRRHSWTLEYFFQVGFKQKDLDLVADQRNHATLFFFTEISKSTEVAIVAEVWRPPLPGRLLLLLGAALPHRLPPPCRRAAALQRCSPSCNWRAVSAPAFHGTRHWPANHIHQSYPISKFQNLPVASRSMSRRPPKMRGWSSWTRPLHTAVGLPRIKMSIRVLSPGHPWRWRRQNPLSS